MEVTTINAELFARMFLAGANNLEAKKEWINALNVFPVPDGDTGTNMSMTIMSAAKEVGAIEIQPWLHWQKQFLPDHYAEQEVTQVLSYPSYSVVLQR